MKKIILLGDSWGVPNYCGPPGVPADHHTEILLRDLGYDVLNCAGNGRSNWKSIKKASDYVEMGHSADWIVWFHTDMFLDQWTMTLDQPFTMHGMAMDISEIVYHWFNQLVNSISAKTIVFGASAPLLDNFDQHVTPTYKINDLRSKIIGRQLPMAYGHHYRELLDHPNNRDSIEDKMALVDAYTALVESMGNTDLFPDGSHPGTQPHIDITDYIVNCIGKP